MRSASRLAERARRTVAAIALFAFVATSAGSDTGMRLVRPGPRIPLRAPTAPPPGLFDLPFFRLFRPGGGSSSAKQTTSGLLAALHVEFSDAASCRRFSTRHGTVFHRYQRFAGVFVPVEQLAAALDSIPRAPGFRALEDDDVLRIPPPAKARATAVSKAIPETIVRGGLGGRTGRGTLIGIIDSGVDFRNADFVTNGPDGPRSRIAAYWDAGLPYDASRGTGRPGPIRYPDGRPVGTVFTGDELTRALRDKLLPDLNDRIGHGTACAGVAAGNGRNLDGAREVMGVAPDAGLLVVRAQVSDEMTGLANFLVAPAIAWMSSVADTLRRPLVVSCSFGSHAGLHDGSRLIERELDAMLPDTAPGRALVVAAGNEGADAIHARVPLGPRPRLLSWACRAEVAMLELHVRADQFDALEIYAAERADGRPTEVELHPLTPIALSSPWRILRFQTKGSVGGIFLASNAPGSQVEAYLVGGQFDPEFAVRTGTVASPATCRAAIAAGSYDWNDTFNQQGTGAMTVVNPCDERPIEVGALSCYSSRGDMLPSGAKPDLAAPGQWYTAPASFAGSNQPAGLNPMSSGGFEGLHDSGRYRLFNGTSAAAPYVAGVVALAFERAPRMTLGDVRRRLRASLTHDETTGAVPNAGWGYGRLDLAAAKRFLGLAVAARPTSRSARSQ